MVDDVIEQAVKRLVESFHSLKIILFGSHARGTADSHSDFDFLVICPAVTNRRKMMVEMDRSLVGLGLARVIIVLTEQEYERDRHIPGTVARPAFLEGRVLYERPH